jgi:hypothetical protein
MMVFPFLIQDLFEQCEIDENFLSLVSALEALRRTCSRVVTGKKGDNVTMLLGDG